MQVPGMQVPGVWLPVPLFAFLGQAPLVQKDSLGQAMEE